MLAKNTLIGRCPEKISVDLKGETVVLNVSSGIYFSIDGVGTRIWELLETPRTVDELVALITAEYEVERRQCETEVIAFLKELVSTGLAEQHDGPAP